MKNKHDDFLKIIECTDFFSTPKVILDIVLSEEKQKELYPKILELFEFEMNIDWFNEMFQNEYAEQKRKAQHFTPDSVAKLLSKISGFEGGTRYEPTAGTGQILIRKWFDDVVFNGICYVPSDYKYVCHELSERTIPFLLLNLSIRGMNAIVIEGDTIEGDVKNVYEILNKSNQYLDFSIVRKISNGRNY